MALRPGGCLLQKRLRERGMSQVDLSLATGLSESMISKYANNHKIMNLKTAKLIAEKLKCSIEDLYEWVPSSAKDDE